MNFTLRPQITKSFLLSKHSEETYIEYYLGLSVKKGLFKNPLRKDNKVTCSFYRNKSNELIFHDFATGQQLNFISIVMAKYNVNYYMALNIIAEDFNLKDTITTKKISKIKESSNKFTSTGPSKIQVEIKDFTKSELSWWKNYGITKDILKKYHVYSCKNIFLNENLFTTGSKLTFGYYGGKIDGLELWRIYYSQRHEYRFLTNWPAKKIQGFEQIPKTGKLLVITKSMKDVMCLYSLGISAIAPNSENLFISDNILNNLKIRFKYIVVLYDNDLPGIHNMNKIKRRYKDLIYTWIPRKYNAKDISDFYKLYGKYKTLEFIKESIKRLK
jgi:hypothetical protein